MNNYYIKIKNELINNEVYKKVKDYSKNRSDLNTYYNVGRLIVEAQGGEKRAKYGDNLIKEYSKRLTNELGKGYSTRNLRNMRHFYLLVKDEIWQSLIAKSNLSWTHFTLLLSLDDTNEIKYYINIVNRFNLTVRDLKQKIKNMEYQRLDNKTKEKLVSNDYEKVEDFIKNPIMIKNIYNYTEISEKILKQLILEDLNNFLKQLGNGFCYIEDEYKIRLGDRYNYIDLLLFNIEFICYVVVELKVIELKAEHIGK